MPRLMETVNTICHTAFFVSIRLHNGGHTTPTIQHLKYPPFRKVPQAGRLACAPGARVSRCRLRFGCAPPTTRLALTSARDLRAGALTDGGAARRGHLRLRPTCATTSTTCVGTRRVTRLLTFPSPAPRYMYATPPIDSHSTMFRTAVTTFKLAFKRAATPGSQPARQIGSGIIGESFASHHITSPHIITAQYSTAQQSAAPFNRRRSIEGRGGGARHQLG